MAKWKISFSGINKQDIDVYAPTEVEAKNRAIDLWLGGEQDIPRTLINYICNIDEQWGKPIK